MIIKGKSTITSLGEWELLAGPKRANQWTPERSAYEVARKWLSVQAPALPRQITDALGRHPAFGTFSEWTAEPEALGDHTNPPIGGHLKVATKRTR